MTTDKLSAADVLRIVAQALRDEAARREGVEDTPKCPQCSTAGSCTGQCKAPAPPADDLPTGVVGGDRLYAMQNAPPPRRPRRGSDMTLDQAIGLFFVSQIAAIALCEWWHQ